LQKVRVGELIPIRLPRVFWTEHPAATPLRVENGAEHTRGIEIRRTTRLLAMAEPCAHLPARIRSGTYASRTAISDREYVARGTLIASKPPVYRSVVSPRSRIRRATLAPGVFGKSKLTNSPH